MRQEKKLNNNVTLMSLAFHTNRACCQWRPDAVVVKQTHLVLYHTGFCKSSVEEKRQDPQIQCYLKTNAQSLSLSALTWHNGLRL